MHACANLLFLHGVRLVGAQLFELLFEFPQVIDGVLQRLYLSLQRVVLVFLTLLCVRKFCVHQSIDFGTN